MLKANTFLLSTLLIVSLNANAFEQITTKRLEQFVRYVSSELPKLNQLKDFQCSEGPNAHALTLCSFEDVCKNVQRSDGYLTLGNIKVPDILLKNKLEALKNKVKSCYDEMNDELDNGSFKDIFTLDDDPNILSVMIDDYGDYVDAKLAIKKAKLEVNRLDEEDQVIEERELSHYISFKEQDLESDTAISLKLIQKYMSEPGKEENFTALMDKIEDRYIRSKLTQFHQQNLGTKRNTLVESINDLLNIDGFRSLDSARPLDRNLKEKRKLVVGRAEKYKNRLMDQISKRNIPAAQKKFLIETLKQSKVYFQNGLTEDSGCNSYYGPTAYMQPKSLNICPSLLDFPIEAIDSVIGHELGHLIDPCLCNIHELVNRTGERIYGDLFELNDENGQHVEGIKYSEYPSNVVDCIVKDPALKVRGLPRKDYKGDQDYDSACGYSDEYGAAPQVQETSADFISKQIMSPEQSQYTREEAINFLVGKVLIKPFACQNNEVFENDPINNQINMMKEELNKYECSYKFAEPIKANPNGPHLTMDKRVNHIFLDDNLKQKLGCDISSPENNEVSQCEF